MNERKMINLVERDLINSNTVNYGIPKGTYHSVAIVFEYKARFFDKFFNKQALIKRYVEFLKGSRVKVIREQPGKSVDDLIITNVELMHLHNFNLTYGADYNIFTNNTIHLTVIVQWDKLISRDNVRICFEFDEKLFYWELSIYKMVK